MHTHRRLTYLPGIQKKQQRALRASSTDRQTEEDTKVALRSAELLPLQKKRVSKAQARKQKMATTRSLARSLAHCTRERPRIHIPIQMRIQMSSQYISFILLQTQHPHSNPDVVPNVQVVPYYESSLHVPIHMWSQYIGSSLTMKAASTSQSRCHPKESFLLQKHHPHPNPDAIPRQFPTSFSCFIAQCSVQVCK